MRRSKIVIALSLALVGAAPALADIKTLGDWEFYGRAHLSIDHLDDGADYSRVNGSSVAPGVSWQQIVRRPDRHLADREQEIFFNLNGSNDDAINRFATRDTFAGLKGSAGQVRFGKFNTPFKAARAPADLFGDQVDDMRNLTRVGSARFDEPREVSSAHRRLCLHGRAQQSGIDHPRTPDCHGAPPESISSLRAACRALM